MTQRRSRPRGLFPSGARRSPASNYGTATAWFTASRRSRGLRNCRRAAVIERKQAAVSGVLAATGTHFFWAIDFLTIDAVAQRYPAVLHVEMENGVDENSAYFIRCAGECRLLAASLPTQSGDAVQILVKLAAELEERVAERADPNPAAGAAAKMDRS